ncbi:hypothetical protein CRYUN_Cryun33cG0057300 [Craigia yunnanensis]
MRSKMQKDMMMKEKERKEQELRALAAKARSERTRTVAPSAAVPMSSDRNAMDTDMRVDYEPVRERERDMPKESKEEREEWLQREKIRDELCKEKERERRGGEVMYDQRLFNQEKGMGSGFATDDQYKIYDEGLFTAQPTLSTLYRPMKDMDSDMYCEKSSRRDRPVEFEKEAEEADPFGFDQFLTEVKKGKKAMEKVCTGGTTKASAGSSEMATKEALIDLALVLKEDINNPMYFLTNDTWLCSSLILLIFVAE